MRNKYLLLTFCLLILYTSICYGKLRPFEMLSDAKNIVFTDQSNDIVEQLFMENETFKLFSDTNYKKHIVKKSGKFDIVLKLNSFIIENLRLWGTIKGFVKFESVEGERSFNFKISDANVMLGWVLLGTIELDEGSYMFSFKSMMVDQGEFKILPEGYMQRLADELGAKKISYIYKFDNENIVSQKNKDINSRKRTFTILNPGEYTIKAKIRPKTIKRKIRKYVTVGQMTDDLKKTDSLNNVIKFNDLNIDLLEYSNIELKYKHNYPDNSITTYALIDTNSNDETDLVCVIGEDVENRKKTKINVEFNSVNFKEKGWVYKYRRYRGQFDKIGTDWFYDALGSNFDKKIHSADLALYTNNSKSDKFFIQRLVPSVNIKKYPLLSLKYKLQDSDSQKIKVHFKIDTDKDGKPDKVFEPPFGFGVRDLTEDGYTVLTLDMMQFAGWSKDSKELYDLVEIIIPCIGNGKFYLNDLQVYGLNESFFTLDSKSHQFYGDTILTCKIYDQLKKNFPDKKDFKVKTILVALKDKAELTNKTSLHRDNIVDVIQHVKMFHEIEEGVPLFLKESEQANVSVPHVLQALTNPKKIINSLENYIVDEIALHESFSPISKKKQPYTLKKANDFFINSKNNSFAFLYDNQGLNIYPLLNKVSNSDEIRFFADKNEGLQIVFRKQDAIKKNIKSSNNLPIDLQEYPLITISIDRESIASQNVDISLSIDFDGDGILNVQETLFNIPINASNGASTKNEKALDVYNVIKNIYKDKTKFFVVDMHIIYENKDYTLKKEINVGFQDKTNSITLSKHITPLSIFAYPLFYLDCEVGNLNHQKVSVEFSVDVNNDGDADEYITIPNLQYRSDVYRYVNILKLAKSELFKREINNFDEKKLYLTDINIILSSIDNPEIDQSSRCHVFSLKELKLFRKGAEVVNVINYLKSKKEDSRENGKTLFDQIEDSHIFEIDGKEYQLKSCKESLNDIDALISNLIEKGESLIEFPPLYFGKGTYNINISQNDFFEVETVEISQKNSQIENEEKQASKVNFKKLDTNHYITFVEAQEPFWLVFAESFHKGWKAYIRTKSEGIKKDFFYDSKWLALFKKKRGKDDWVELNNHDVINGYANGWWVPIDQINSSVKLNRGELNEKKTKKEFVIVVEYTPHYSVEKSVIFFAVVFTCGILFFGVRHFKKRDNGHNIKKNKKYLVNFIGIIISLVCLWFFLKRIDWGLVYPVLMSTNIKYVVFALAISFSSFLIRAFRLQYMLFPIKKVSINNMISVTLVSFMANIILPARVGEIVRATLITKKEDIKFGSSFSAIIIERIFDTLALIIFTGIVFFLFVYFTKDNVALSFQKTGLNDQIIYNNSFMDTILIFMGIFSGVSFAVLIFFGFLIKYPSKLKLIFSKIFFWIPKLIREKASTLMDSFVDGLQMLHSKKRFLFLIVFSIPILIIGSFTIYILSLSISMQVPLIGAGFILVCISFAVALPQAPGFIGVFHFAVEKSLSMLGVDVYNAQSFAILLWFVTVIPIIVYGLIALWYQGWNFNKIKTLKTTVSGKVS